MAHRFERTGAKDRVDWGFVAVIAGLLAMGTIAVLSAASPLPYYSNILQRHFLALLLGILLFFIGLGFNYQVFQDQARPIYAAILALLVAVLFFGATQRGHRAWFHISFLTFQPSELARIGLILVLANELDRRWRRIHELATVLRVLAIAAPVLVLIMKEPDLTTTLTFFPVIIGMLFCAGVGASHLLAVFGYGAVALAVPMVYILCQVRYAAAAPGSLPALLLQGLRFGPGVLVLVAAIAVLAFLAWRLAVMMHLHPRPLHFAAVAAVLSAGMVTGTLITRELKGYQRNRFVAYLSPESDIQGASYHVHQSQIALGSGGLWGKGLFSGTQSQLGFLPERHTDFLYSVVGEEMGFWGTTAILILYLMLIWRVTVAARSARDRYGFLVCCGIASLLAACLVLNVGMCVGLMPVAGMPLPLISYGGSSLVITLWSLGIVANIYSRRYSLL